MRKDFEKKHRRLSFLAWSKCGTVEVADLKMVLALLCQNARNEGLRTELTIRQDMPGPERDTHTHTPETVCSWGTTLSIKGKRADNRRRPCTCDRGTHIHQHPDLHSCTAT